MLSNTDRSSRLDVERNSYAGKHRRDFGHVLCYPKSFTCIKFQSAATLCEEQNLRRFLDGKLDTFSFYQLGIYSVFPVIPNLCHFKPFGKTSKRSLLSHNVLSICNHNAPREPTHPRFRCFVYRKESECAFVCVCNLIVLRVKQITLDITRNTCIITFTCSIQ